MMTSLGLQNILQHDNMYCGPQYRTDQGKSPYTIAHTIYHNQWIA